MKIQVLIPNVGESVSEVQISKWLTENNSYVEKDSEIAEIDTDKTSLTISASISGIISILLPEGTTCKIGSVVAEIDEAEKPVYISSQKENTTAVEVQAMEITQKPIDTKNSGETEFVISPLASSVIEQDNIDIEELKRFLLRYRIEVKDIEDFRDYKKETQKGREYYENKQDAQENDSYRKKMSPLRKKLAQRLVSVKNETAMLTTFNEIDMSNLIEIRKKYQEEFKNKYGIKLGYMSFFTKACAIALLEFPQVNAMIDDDDIVYHNFCNIGIAVSTEKGLVVPVVRNTERIGISEIEKQISTLAEKARNNKLVPEDFEQGTFTLTNGGVFGSMFSTPIINPPQTAILGMHAVQDRAIVVNSAIVIRPMMYIALSYDHRLIDGKESVGFIMKVKHLLENPENLFSNGRNIYRELLSL